MHVTNANFKIRVNYMLGIQAVKFQTRLNGEKLKKE